VVKWFDRRQRAHGVLGFPIAVIYKFFDDRGPYLAALVTYYAFVSLFPLLLIFFSVLGFLLQGNAHLRQQLVDSALQNFPIIGPELAHNVSSFRGSAIGIVVGVVVSLYGALGAMQAAQASFNQIYGIPRNEQPNPFKSRLRSLALVALLGTAILLATGVATVVGTSNPLSARLGLPLRTVGYVLTFVINVALFSAAFQLLTASDLRLRDVILGGVVGAAGWAALQTFGTSFAAHQLSRAGSVYGTFGLVLATIAWLYLEALLLMLAAEMNAVRSHRLWPRALLTPFTDHVVLTEADRRAYTMYAQTQRFKGFQTITSEFGNPHDSGPPESTGGPESASSATGRSSRD
jgi:YihY family inner membrane protein